jgi:SSS family solute:Na+ symporter
MNLHAVDWAIVLFVFAVIMGMAWRTRGYSRTTADFLAANRCAGRYLLSVSEGMAGLGAISIIGIWQMAYKIGFAPNWWGKVGAPLGLLMMISGWVLYRYRESRVLTLAQLFEVRYSRRFRIFGAVICYISGLLNYGIFPAVGAAFFVHYGGLPATCSVGGFEFSTTVSIVILLVSAALLVALFSGQIAVIITDFVQSMFVIIVMLVITGLVLIKYSLGDVFDSMLIGEPGKSLVDPYDAGGTEFDPLFFIIGLVGMFLNRLSFQSNQGYNCAATSPHEAKMASTIGVFRQLSLFTCLTLIPLVSYMLMHNDDHVATAAQVTALLSGIENKEIAEQMLVPVTMLHYLPVGLVGALAAVMLVAFISTNDTQMHSWGSIFVQDIIIPLRKKPLSNKQHMRLIRLSITAVALFAIAFSCLFEQTQDIFQWFAITGAFWLGGCGCVIVGALYTRWGTTSAAYAALISGSVIAGGGLLLEQIWQKRYGEAFYLTGQELYGIAMAVSCLLYVAVSFLGRRQRYNLDKLLHRGRYVVPSDHEKAEAALTGTRIKLKNIFGITDEFSKGDKAIYGLTIAQTGILFVVWIIVTLFSLRADFGPRQWATYHYIWFMFDLVVALAIAVWIITAGFRDLARFFRRLNAAPRDALDDGRVFDHDCQLDKESP